MYLNIQSTGIVVCFRVNFCPYKHSGASGHVLDYLAFGESMSPLLKLCNMNRVFTTNGNLGIIPIATMIQYLCLYFLLSSLLCLKIAGMEV